MYPQTKSGYSRAAATHAFVYSFVMRVPSLLICARRRRARAWGGGPRADSAEEVDGGVLSSTEAVESDFSNAGGGEVEVVSMV